MCDECGYITLFGRFGLNKSDTGDSSERVTPRELVEVTLVSPGQWSQLTLVHRGQ